MRYLGIDYGSKRIGLALSDEQGTVAFPYATVQNLSGVLKAIAKESVRGLIIGLPLSSAGEEGQEAGEVRKFAAGLVKKLKSEKALRGGAAPVIEFENELFTTKIAEEHAPKDKADAAAAALILQLYLDRVK